MAKETAEQKLLKLIESADAQSGSDSAAGSSVSSAPGAAQESPSANDAARAALQSVRGGGMPSVSLPSFGNIFSFFKRFELFSKSPSEYSLKDINKVLIILIVIIGLFFTKSLISGMRNAGQNFDFSYSGEPVNSSKIGLPSLRDLAQYVQVISQRNIFQPYEKKVMAEAEVPVENQKIKDKLQALRLVGISWLDSPDTATAMVEDQKTSITHFLRKGDSLGGVKVEEIYADRVKFRMGDETVSIGL